MVGKDVIKRGLLGLVSEHTHRSVKARVSALSICQGNSEGVVVCRCVKIVDASDGTS